LKIEKKEELEKDDEDDDDVLRITTHSIKTIIIIVAIGIFTFTLITLQQENNNNNNMDATAQTESISPSSVSLPLSKGYVNGKVAYFISTDASESQIVSSISNTTSFKVNYAPSLSNTSESARQKGYVFVNGVKGEGPIGSQISVASALPGDKGYSPLFQINYVKWNNNNNNSTTIRVLKSVNEIMTAQKNGELTITPTNIVINSPAIQLQ
jgi:hypothetical protein